jgi:hypothetical protein
MREDAMRRFRLGTLMLLIVIAALSIALALQHYRAARREAGLQRDIALLNGEISELQRLHEAALKHWLSAVERAKAERGRRE